MVNKSKKNYDYLWRVENSSVTYINILPLCIKWTLANSKKKVDMFVLAKLKEENWYRNSLGEKIYSGWRWSIALIDWWRN